MSKATSSSSSSATAPFRRDPCIALGSPIFNPNIFLKGLKLNTCGKAIMTNSTDDRGYFDGGSEAIDERQRYSHDTYVTKQRFCSYWHQIEEILKSMPGSVIEVGKGNGFVSDYLKNRGVDVLTLDLDKELGPDVVGNVTNLPFKNASFDVVACYEVLEHLPYALFIDSLMELRRVGKGKVLISLPDANPVVPLAFAWPGLSRLQMLVPQPIYRARPIPKSSHHQWEVGRFPHKLNAVLRDIQSAGLKVVATYRVFENPYHRFFLLSG